MLFVKFNLSFGFMSQIATLAAIITFKIIHLCAENQENLPIHHTDLRYSSSRCEQIAQIFG
jgi:hypothetical protein